MRLPLNIAWSFGALARIARSGQLPRLRAFWRHEAGATVVLAAILFPIVIGGMGLGAETGYWYLTQRKLQHTADVSAHAGAIRKRSGDDPTEIRAAANHIAAASGVEGIVVNNPPTSGECCVGDINSVEVSITQAQPLLFSSLFMGAPVTIFARSVAQVLENVNPTVACVLALSPTAAGAVTVSGSATVDLTGCGIHSNSNAADAFLMTGAPVVTADCVSTVGGRVIAGGTLTVTDPDCKSQIAEIPDPYAGVAEPVVPGPCWNKSNVGTPNNTTPQSDFVARQVLHPSGVNAVTFCGGLDLKGDVNFAPGLYIIQGDVTVTAGDNTRLSGAGVTFFITDGGRLRFNGAAQLNLEAPTEGPFKGILFFGDRDDQVTHTINGGSGSTLQGAIYSTGSNIEYRGNSEASGGCTQLIGSTITFIGASTMSAECQSAGTTDIVMNQIVKLVE